MRTSARSGGLRWLLGGTFVSVVLAVGIIFVVAAATMTSVNVRNEGTEPLRLSGCSIDDALDLLPGRTGSIDVLQDGREGCSVYDQDNYRYIGCLTVTARTSHLIHVRESLNAKISETDCERIG